MKILFVCAGNTCRSVMAEYLLRQTARNMEVSSCGLFAVAGSTANPLTLQVLKELGIDGCAHLTAGVNERIISAADLVLAMELSQKLLLHTAYAKYREKIFTLRGYGAADADIGDPYGADLDAYRQTRDLIFLEIKRIMKLISAEEK